MNLFKLFRSKIAKPTKSRRTKATKSRRTKATKSRGTKATKSRRTKATKSRRTKSVKRGGGCAPDSTAAKPNVWHSSNKWEMSQKCCNGRWKAYNGLNKGCP